MVNPVPQNNKVKTFLILEAFKAYEQDLDETEDIKVVLIDFNSFGNQHTTAKVKTQLFTSNAYFMARNYIAENMSKNSTISS